MQAGCFWGVEENFRIQVAGVVDTKVGYSGGTVDLSKQKNPYKLVCTNKTGHAETVEVTFDPEIVSYDQLVDSFFHFHDPTTLNREGPDVGTQYRSAIFYSDEAQEEIATRVKGEWDRSGRVPGRIVTEIAPLTTFYPAEEYHQKYFKKNGAHGCLTYFAWTTEPQMTESK